MALEVDETVLGTAPSAEPARGPGVGQTLARYTLERVLGEGGMGIVYLAHDPELDRHVALKLIRGTATTPARARLGREARAMAKLAHPNVITVFEVDTFENRDFVVMELIDGMSLDRWAKGRSLDELIEVFVQAARGLAAAHAKDMVHRDFKPHNVLIGRDGRVVVTDFGLARAADSEAQDEPRPGSAVPPAPTSTPSWSSTLTATGSLMGTPAYMAPEQWDGGPVQATADQFAFCVALWEAATGQRPFVGTTFDELATAVRAGPPDAPQTLPGWLTAILRRGLAVRPRDRWPSMTSLVTALERGRRRRQRLLRGLVLSVGSLAIAGLAMAWFARDTKPVEQPPPTVAAAPDERLVKTLTAVLRLPEEPGNACSDYFELLKHPVALDMPWAEALTETARPTIEPIARSPEIIQRLEHVRAGARKRSCEIVGLLVPFPPLARPFSWDIPDLTPWLHYSALVRVHARDLAEHGDRTAARQWLESLLIMGWHLQEEPLVLFGVHGATISSDAARLLAEVDPDPERSARWAALGPLFRARRTEEWNTMTGVVPRDDAAIEDRARIVDTTGFLRGARAEAMVSVAVAHLVRDGDLDATAQQRAHFERWSAMSDARLAAFARYFRGVFSLPTADRDELRHSLEDQRSKR